MCTMGKVRSKEVRDIIRAVPASFKKTSALPLPDSGTRIDSLEKNSAVQARIAHKKDKESCWSMCQESLSCVQTGPGVVVF